MTVINDEGQVLNRFNFFDVIVILIIAGTVLGGIFQIGKYSAKSNKQQTADFEAHLKAAAENEAEARWAGLYQQKMRDRDIWVEGYKAGFRRKKDVGDEP